MSLCFERAGMTKDEVDAIFAPAPSVPAFDRAIAASLGTVFGTAGAPPITATRSLLGHSHAASSALDSIAAIKALETSRLPATLNLCRPIADLPFVHGASRSGPLSTALVGAYGFGGHAAALAWRRYEA